MQIESDYFAVTGISINIPKEVIELLQQYKNECVKVFDIEGKTKVFAQINGKPMFSQTPGKWFNKFLKRNKLPHITFHGLRHTNISLLVSLGFDIKTIGARSGHADSEMIHRVYSHPFKNKDKLASAGLSKLLISHEEEEELTKE